MRCHSLNCKETCRGESEEVFPPALLVSKRKAESNRSPNPNKALPSEYGSAFNIRVLTSSEAPVARGVSALGNDVYYNSVMGKQALTHINQDGCSMQLIYRDPMYSGMLAQNATLAVKFTQGQGLTQDTGIRNLLSTRRLSIGV